jgi:hypothetical protein
MVSLVCGGGGDGGGDLFWLDQTVSVPSRRSNGHTMICFP